MKIITIIGTRPQFVKASTVSAQIRKFYKNKIEEVIVHTGQHFDKEMSLNFFNDLKIPNPKYNLKVNELTHAKMTSKMMEKIEKLIIDELPDLILLYGDTNSTLAGALVASKMNIPIAHVEAGLRSYNMKMPEEINRIISDKLSTLLFCPTKIAVSNLKKEGISKNVYMVGDVMLDLALSIEKNKNEELYELKKYKLCSKKFAIFTCHREENVKNYKNLKKILWNIKRLSQKIKIIFPIHPGTKKLVNEYSLKEFIKDVIVVEPLSYFKMMKLIQSSMAVITDSGGLQKEAFFYKIPCITIRNETEWVETVNLGLNYIVGLSYKKLNDAIDNILNSKSIRNVSSPYGDGNAAKKIIEKILEFDQNKNKF